jgi:hypothetical protein
MCHHMKSARWRTRMMNQKNFLGDINHLRCTREAKIKLRMSIPVNQIRPPGVGIKGSGKELVERVIKTSHSEVY